mgnify:FL=1|jgi:50S ribosomal protein L7/L12
MFYFKKIALSKKIHILDGVFLSLDVNKMTQTNEELMKNYQQLLQFVRNSINKAEMELKRAKLTLGQLMHFDPSNPESLTAYLEEMRAENPENLKSYKEEGMEVIEGIFDGYYMIGANQMKYPVPVNYSSKTKLIPGDVLKLKILADGKFIYKLIKPAERKHLRAVLSKSDENKYTANTEDGKVYFLNQAAVSFYLGNPGDELYVIVNENGEGNFAAIEAIIKK